MAARLLAPAVAKGIHAADAATARPAAASSLWKGER